MRFHIWGNRSRYPPVAGDSQDHFLRVHLKLVQMWKKCLVFGPTHRTRCILSQKETRKAWDVALFNRTTRYFLTWLLSVYTEVEPPPNQSPPSLNFLHLHCNLTSRVTLCPLTRPARIILWSPPELEKRRLRWDMSWDSTIGQTGEQQPTYWHNCKALGVTVGRGRLRVAAQRCWNAVIALVAKIHSLLVGGLGVHRENMRQNCKDVEVHVCVCVSVLNEEVLRILPAACSFLPDAVPEVPGTIQESAADNTI